MFSLFGTNDLSPLRMHFVIWNVFLNFYLTHFEKYNTGNQLYENFRIKYSLSVSYTSNIEIKVVLKIMNLMFYKF